MNCRQAKELIPGCVDGTLEPPRARELSDHLAGCEQCRGELEDVRKTVALVRGLAPVTAPDLVAGVRARLNAEARGERARRPALSWPSLTSPQVRIALAAGLLIVVGFYGMKEMGGGRNAPKPSLQGTGAGEPGPQPSVIPEAEHGKADMPHAAKLKAPLPAASQAPKPAAEPAGTISFGEEAGGKLWDRSESGTDDGQSRQAVSQPMTATRYTRTEAPADVILEEETKTAELSAVPAMPVGEPEEPGKPEELRPKRESSARVQPAEHPPAPVLGKSYASRSVPKKAVPAPAQRAELVVVAGDPQAVLETVAGLSSAMEYKEEGSVAASSAPTADKVEARKAGADEKAASSTVVSVRIPPSRYSELLAALKKHGEVTVMKAAPVLADADAQSADKSETAAVEQAGAPMEVLITVVRK